MRTIRYTIVVLSVVTTLFAQGGGNLVDFGSSGDNYINCGGHASLEISAAITVEAWIFPTIFNDYNIVCAKIGGNRTGGSVQGNFYCFDVYLGSGTITYRISHDGTSMVTVSGSALSTNKWYHVTLTYDGSYLRGYLDGKQVGTPVNTPGTIYTSTSNPFWIGDYNFYYWPFRGKIDDVRVWDVALSESTIRDWMHKEVTSSHPNYNDNLKGYWKFNETSGTTAYDASGNSANGTLVNSCAWATSTAPIGSNGAFVNTTNQTSVGPTGGQIKVTITSTPGDANNLGVYQFGTVSGEPVSSDTLPGGLDKRSNIVWGIAERGDVTANLVFDYSNVSGIGTPATIKLLKRSDASSKTWAEVTLTDRDNDDRTLTVNGVTSFSEFALGAGSDNSLPVELTSFIAENQSGTVLLSWVTESEAENLGFIVERKNVGANHDLPSEWSQIASYVTNKSLTGHGSTSEKHEYQYADKTVQPGVTYLYRLADVDYGGKVTWHKEVEVKVEVQDVQIPEKFGLQPVYPNPFNPALTIPYGLTEDGQITLKVYNLRGQLVETLMNTNALKGAYSYTWQPLNLSAGIYFIQLQSGNKTNLQKVVFVK